MDTRIAAILSDMAFPVYLAPMEGVTDQSFRLACKEMGADVLISEFVSSDALSRAVDKSIRKMQFDTAERPYGVQIFGHDEQSLVAAAQMAAEAQPDFIDINWGCPVKKVVSKGAGSAILQDIPKMERLTRAVVDSVSLPVTVKTRLGWDCSNKPIVEVAERMQDVGVEAIAIHGRTRSQMYTGPADWTLIGEVKNNPRMRIPVVGNGDVNSGEKAVELRNRYGVDAVMVGRAAIGNPWIFKQIKDYVAGRECQVPDYAERVALVTWLLESTAAAKGERRAVLEMRTQYAGFFKGLVNFKSTRMKLMQAVSLAECVSIMSEYKEDAM